MRICSIIGARPQFVKAAALSAEIAERGTEMGLEEVSIHTGQHYDRGMSDIFFEELSIPPPKHELGIGSGAHGAQTGRMLEAIEEKLLEEDPDAVLVYGDTNSTLAGALAAVKLHIPVAHVEAGMRSFNRRMPEEINRVVTDHVASINLCSTKTAVENLEREGLEKTAVLTGDIMFDCALKFAEIARKRRSDTAAGTAAKGPFVLMTCHRAENTDVKERISGILDAAAEIAREHRVVFPVHPRTSKALEKLGLSIPRDIEILPPIGYLDTLFLEKNARVVLTDSGGMQKEAFFFTTPCVTMRDETEWVETIEMGVNVLAGASKDKIVAATAAFAENPPAFTDESPYGDGKAAAKILDAIKEKV